MSDRTFELSFIALSVLALLWMVLASIFIFSPVWAIIVGLVVWLVGGGALLYYWGKRYMSRL